jgi:hypothetical protein
VILFLAGAGCVLYYWLVTGWQGAIVGRAMYLLVLMTALWIL